MKVLVIGDSIHDVYEFVEKMEPAVEGESGHARICRRSCYRSVFGGVKNVGWRIGRGGHEVVEVDQFLTTFTEEEIEVPVKRRIMVGSKVLLRIDDEEQRQYLTKGQMTITDSGWERVSQKWDACVIVDYGKGFLDYQNAQEIIRRVRRNGCKIVVMDPKGPYFRFLEGLTLVTPNAGEFKTAYGREYLEVSDLEPDQVMVETRGVSGFSVWVPGGEWPAKVPALEVHPVDVCGAGEAFIAQAVLSLLKPLPLFPALYEANQAAAACVRHLGCRPLVGTGHRG